MPSVSDIISIRLNLDTSGLDRGIQQAQAAAGQATRNLQQQGAELERVAKSVGVGLETLIKGVAGFFGLVLSFEGFKHLVTDAAQAGTSMGRFAESIGKTVETTQAYKQAFTAFTGGETGVLNAIRKIKLDLSAFPLVYTEWMNSVERLTGKTVRGKEPERILQEINEAAVRRHLNAAQLHMWVGEGLGLSDADFLLLTKPEGAGSIQERLKEQREKVGTPTTPQVQAMEELQKDITNLQTVSNLLAMQTATMMEPWLHELISMTINVVHWLRGIATMAGLKPPEEAAIPAPAPAYKVPSGSAQPSPQSLMHAPAGGGTSVKGSWFNDQRTASGRSAATTEGIAVPSGGKMGDWYEVTTPDGRKFVTQLIDRGPAGWTGRGVDVSKPLADRMYPGNNFPTDGRFTVKPLSGAPPSAVILHRSGATADAVDDALKLEGLHERRDRDTIREYLRTGGAGMDPATTSWCAAFVNASLQREGVRGSGSAIATSFLRWGGPATGGVQKGDVLVEARGRGPGEMGGHVGMATGRTREGPAGTEYEIVAGNTRDSVRKYWIAASRVTVRRATPNVATGSAPAAAASEANRPRVENNQSDTHVNQVIVHTHATNATGIASDVKDAIGKQFELVPGD